MRPLIGIVAALGLFAVAGAAQDNPDQQKAAMKAKMNVEIDQMLRGAKVIGIEAGIMGPTVKGQPYSADEIHETTQVLADGTRIHNETKTTVYRDSQGRIRRESPGQIMIWDSTAGTSYILNQSSQTAQKMQMAVNYVFKKTGPPDGPPEEGTVRTFHFNNGGPAAVSRQMIVVKDMADAQAAAEAKAQLREPPSQDAKKETLATQIMEGVSAEGVRLTTTIEAGAIGNDRPIQSTEERWYSSELQVNLLVRKTDPRTGEDTVRLTNVRRIEPDPTLFTLPPGYQVK
jgi:hypothetical protein